METIKDGPNLFYQKRGRCDGAEAVSWDAIAFREREEMDKVRAPGLGCSRRKEFVRRAGRNEVSISLVDDQCDISFPREIRECFYERRGVYGSCLDDGRRDKYIGNGLTVKNVQGYLG